LNQVQKLREERLMAKAELARKAGVSESTIDRVEAGQGCRMETKRKILFALGLAIEDGAKVFKRPGANGTARGRPKSLR
jgi:DNA-binding XRE family transcriptional regulator